MRVVFLSPCADLGGAERMLLAMLAGLRRHTALEPSVLLLGDGPLRPLIEDLGVACTTLPMPASLERMGDSQLQLGTSRWGKAALLGRSLLALPGLVQFVRRFRNVVRMLRPDLLHSNGIKTHLLSRLAGVDATPTLWHVHDFYGTRPLASRLLRWASRRMEGALAISRAVAEDVRKTLPGRPVTVVPNAIDLERFQPRPCDPAQLDRLAGLPPPSTAVARVGLVATYARWKGQDVFLKAAALLRGAPARFYVIGGPVYRTDGSQFSESELRRLISVHGLGGQVGLIGFQQRPEEIYPTLDVVVHASTRPEPFGLTIAEAMACGRAVVVAGAGGAAELVEHGRDGLAIAPGDPAALAEAIRSLLTSAELRQSLGAAARSSAVARFDQNRLGAQLQKCYEQVLDPRKLAGWDGGHFTRHSIELHNSLTIDGYPPNSSIQRA